MNPINEHEHEIKWRVDRKAQAILRGTGSWESVTADMKIAVPFELSSSDMQYLENYVAWVQAHPELE